MFRVFSCYVVRGVAADTVRPTGLEWAGGATGAGAEHVPPSHSLPALGTSGAGHLRAWTRTLAGGHGQAAGKGLQATTSSQW